MPAYKVIKTGHIIEIYEYEKIIAIDRPHIEDDSPLVQVGDDSPIREDRSDEHKKRSAQRARQNIRRLIQNNFTDGDTFITLTYKENMEDIQTANYDLKKFVQKMKRRQSDFKHVTVIEFQKRGAVHYHMICNYRCDKSTESSIKDIERHLGEKVWKHGFVDLKDIYGVDNVGAYVVKYMTKGNRDDRLFGQKSYFTGGELERPIEIKDQEEVALYINSFIGQIPTFTNSFESEWTGKVVFREYNTIRMEREGLKF